MKEGIKFLIVLILFISLAGLLKAFMGGVTSFESADIKIAQEGIGQEVILIIDDGQSIQDFEMNFREGMTAFGLLEEKIKELDINIETKSYDIGIFIEAIGESRNGEDQKYWLYYVNGEMPMVSADKKELKAGDKVEFKFEKSSF